MRNHVVVFVTCLYTAVAVAQNTNPCSNIIVPKNAAPVVAPGWQAQLVAGGLTKPRSIQFDSTGALLVVESGKGISRHRFSDNGGTCLSANHSHIIVEETKLNHGLALSTDGKTLYASSSESVYSWTYDAVGGTVISDYRILINGMSNNDLVTRTLLISQHQPNTLIVSRGSSDQNKDRASILSNGLSQIRSFNISNLTRFSAPFNFNSEGTVLGWGLRNSVGLAEHPVSGGIYAVENSVDGVTRNGINIKENNPGEELNFLGYLNGTEMVNQGKNFGYPHCFAVWDPKEIPEGDGLVVGKQFAVEEDGEGLLSDEVCEKDYVSPRLTFPAHYAPMDVKFDGGGGRGYVSFRGSCETSPVGYRVAYIDFDPVTGEPTAEADNTSPLEDIITNSDHSKCPDGCFRPVGLAIDDQGRIWFSSDSTGEIYVMQEVGRNGNQQGVFVGQKPDFEEEEEEKGKNGAGRVFGWETKALVTLGVCLGLGMVL
ncbi:soluble quino protein glucose/sorbosone dehydrogenase [Podospora fimiseda]|uniref:Soluble quino protein glucose/sorbosone dehydrogenase n=1 Tax=Podospora fimiseda TaxID=252190 RepID=A0AAN7BGM2_9PEZI|nr:soluble quino protein glucose/sorbosone dehydrogenase [Podospora fimiseda]